jgi:hypothetical protein
MRPERIFDRSLNRRDGGLMQNVLHSVNRLIACFPIGEIAVNEFDGLSDWRQSLLVACRQIVDNAHLRSMTD